MNKLEKCRVSTEPPFSNRDRAATAKGCRLPNTPQPSQAIFRNHRRDSHIRTIRDKIPSSTLRSALQRKEITDGRGKPYNLCP